jgi:hypothetical protein
MGLIGFPVVWMEKRRKIDTLEFLFGVAEQGAAGRIAFLKDTQPIRDRDSRGRLSVYPLKKTVTTNGTKRFRFRCFVA